MRRTVKTTRIKKDERLYAYWSGSVSADLEEATIALAVDGVEASPYAMTWEAPALNTQDGWARTARTSGCVVGSEATAEAGDISIPPGNYSTRVLLTLADGQVLSSDTQQVRID